MAGLLVKSNQSDLLNRLTLGREAALESHSSEHWSRAVSLGLPGPKHEDWKYTPLDRLYSLDLSASNYASLSQSGVDKLKLPLDAYVLTFVDGEFRPSLSQMDDINFKITPLTDEHKQALPLAISGEFFLHLTEALNPSGVLVEIPSNLSVEKPIYLLSIASQGERGMSHVRNHLKLNTGSSACIIEHHVTLDEPYCDNNPEGKGHLVGSRLTMDVADNSQLVHYKIINGQKKQCHFGHNDIHAGRDTRICSQTFLLSGALTRHHTSARLDGENSDLFINSLSLPSNDQIYDTRTYLEHNASHCNSEQIHKIIAQDQSKAVFNGLIKVAKHAIKTDGQMDNHNLLLNDGAEVNTKPQLEIYADDVKCSHGTTTGSLSKEQLFYLGTRGIDSQTAEQMITLAFAGELTEVIGIPEIKENVFNAVSEKLGERNQ
ncbi:Fe-S cluster assembly protein SufD [Veronia nyctiphanis]|uniref:Fe-S cluster assembly protein SufD n=1 Tax=Veronia nyctiphanis TaxID=1278244 RepID=A0A4Q0YMV6_9GAMM|nr:Fe-S cluster assembly protein SufD [Veronia nyctiphanis]RXJ71705.1 Fe-S cluster assembly protein SufD [Veronia nyctiphanis]